MATRKRKPLEEILHDFQQFMYYRSQKAAASKSFTGFGNRLKKILDERGEEQFDEDGNPGNIVFKFGRPVYIGEKPYVGFEKRRSYPQPVFDEDKALELAEEKNIVSDVVTDVTLTMPYRQYLKLVSFLESGSGYVIPEDLGQVDYEVDQNAFYRLQQRGKISEEELDSLLVLPEGAEPSYAFWPLEASPEDLGEDE